MKEGRILAAGGADEVVTGETLRRTYGVNGRKSPGRAGQKNLYLSNKENP